MTITWVNLVNGIPILRDFQSTKGSGPPLCVDTTTNIAYYLAAGDIPVPLGGIVSVAIPDGDKGDIIVSAGGLTWTIDNDAVTYAKLQNVSNVSRLLGRGSALGAGDPEEITLGAGLTMTGTVLSVTSPGVDVGLFADIATMTIPANVSAVSTAGYTTEGEGAGIYVEDSLADAALFAAHPLFVQQNGARYFRLMAANGEITVEQGGATGTGNDQPAIQAAVSYAAAVGIQRLQFTRSAYEVWCPVRTTVVGTGHGALDGLPLVVISDLELVGCEGGTLLDLRSPTGAVDRTQTVSGSPWLGGAIFYTGSAITRIAQNNLIFEGGLTYNYGDARVVDLNDKGLYADLGFIPNLVRIDVEDCEYRNFAGEIFYGAGSFVAGTSGVIRNLKLHGSPQSAFNFNIMESLLIENIEAGNSYQPTELIGGPGRVFVGGRFYDGFSSSIFAGPSPSYVASYPYTWADRDDAAVPPFIDWEGTRFENAGQVIFGGWQRGKIVTIDTPVTLNYAVGHLRDVHLEIEAWADRQSGFPALAIGGPPTLTTQVTDAPVGVYYSKPSNINVDVKLNQTALAVANNRVMTGLSLGDGLMDSTTCHFTISGGAMRTWEIGPNHSGTPVAGYAVPAIAFDATLIAGAQYYGGTSGGIVVDTAYRVRWSCFTFYQAGAGTYNITLDNTYTYAFGQRVIFYHGGGGANDRILSFAANGTGLKLPADRLLRTAGDLLELEWNGSVWQEVRFTGTTTIATDSILGRSTAGTGVVETLTALPFAFTGDVTRAADSNAQVIPAGTVTLAMQANMATGSLVYRKTGGAGAPEVNPLATLKTDLLLTGTNSGDQTTIAGITGTLAEFNTALTGADFATGGGTVTGASSGTNTGDQTTITGNAGTATALQNSRNFSITGGGITAAAVGFNGTANVVLSASVDAAHITLARMADMAAASLIYRKTAGAGVPEVNSLATLKTDLGLTGTNSGDQTSIVGLSGTLAQFNTACTDADFARTDAANTFTGVQTLSSAPVFSAGIAPAQLPNGLTNGNSAAQSQVVVSATNYYITNSNLNLPNPLKSGMVVGTRFTWRVALTKTAAGTGIFQISIYRGTNGSTADTQDVLQTIGTQTAVVDSMVVDVSITVTVTGAAGSYFWSIIPVNKAATATGFGVATGPGGFFSGTVAGVALNTASLTFGLGFKATTGTPTIVIPMVQAYANNIS